MTDTADTGGRIDSAVARAKSALDNLRQQLATKADQIGQEINTLLDEVQTAIDEIQASWAERPQPDNTLPGQQPPQPVPSPPTQQLPADQSQGQSQGSVGNAPQPPGGVAPPR